MMPNGYLIFWSMQKNKDVWRPNLLPRSEEMNLRYKNPDNNPRGDWKSGDLSVRTYSAEYDYPITTPSGRIVNSTGWKMLEMFKRKIC